MALKAGDSPGHSFRSRRKPNSDKAFAAIFRINLAMKRLEQMTLSERLYLPEILKGMLVTNYHFMRNLTLHVAHLMGFAKNRRAATTVQYPEERKTLFGRLSRQPSPDAQAGRLGAMHLVLSVRHRVSRAMHLYRSGRVSRSPRREVPVALRDRHAAMHLLRVLRRGLPLRRDQDGHLRPSAHLGFRSQGLHRAQGSPDASLAGARAERTRRQHARDAGLVRRAGAASLQPAPSRVEDLQRARSSGSRGTSRPSRTRLRRSTAITCATAASSKPGTWR